MFNLKIPKFLRFVIIGVINTVIDLGALNLLILSFGLQEPFLFSIYKAVSFSLAIINSYWMNKKFTFEFTAQKATTFPMFVLVSLVGLGVNVGGASVAFYLLEKSFTALGGHALATISGVTGSILGLAVNYLSYKHIVFK